MIITTILVTVFSIMTTLAITAEPLHTSAYTGQQRVHQAPMSFDQFTIDADGNKKFIEPQE